MVVIKTCINNADYYIFTCKRVSKRCISTMYRVCTCYSSGSVHIWGYWQVKLYIRNAFYFCECLGWVINYIHEYLRA